MCKEPYRQGVAEFGCGICLPCRFNRRRLWTGRFMLEELMHDSSSFVTLTYSDRFLPADGSVVPRHLQLFVKRLRYYLDKPIRYYGVGEYGERTWRPHYHLAIFGSSDVGSVESAWTMGHTHVGSLTPESASYVCGYIVNGKLRPDGPEVRGLHPEFARMSLRPYGLGAGALDAVVSFLESRAGARYLAERGDVPHELRRDGKRVPLGRYLRRKLRERLGMDPGEPVALGERKARELWLELKQPGARSAREEKRLQVSRRAEVLSKIHQSRKGFGL